MFIFADENRQLKNYITKMNHKRAAFIAFILLLGISMQAKDIYVSTSFHEPATEGLRFIYSYDGLRWDSIEGVFLRPEVGTQRVMRDPSIVQGPDGTFHLVWTSSWRGDRGFGYAASRDLIHWTPQRFISTGMDTTTVNTWAPELFYDDTKRQFIIVWASCVPGRFPDYQEDHKNNHRLYYMTTKDFRRFSKAKLFYDPGFSVIDATLTSLELRTESGEFATAPRNTTESGEFATTPRNTAVANSKLYTLNSKLKYVMVLKDNSRPMRKLKVAFADSPYGPWSEASEPFTESFTEGPTVARVGDWWYIYYDSYQHRIYGAHRTKDFQTFQDQTGAVSFPVGHKHGTVFMADEQLVEGLIKYNRDVVHYSGTTMALTERHDGGLKPVVGVHSIQTMRGGTPSSTAAPSSIVGDFKSPPTWTYNHQPMLAYWNGRFYMHYLTDPRHEHEAPGKTMMQTSTDGYTWTAPVELFPEYPVPEGWTKASRPDLPPAHNLKAVMHQRTGWYTPPRPPLGGVTNGGTGSTHHTLGGAPLLATGYYGICLTMKDDPNDGNGIGRVVRRVFEDGTLGPIYFIYYNHGFSERNTVYPYYKKSKDKALVKAVDQMLADPMQRMQWVEESDRGDALIPLDKPYKAFSSYTLPDGRKVALWKHAVTSLSADGGNTWRLTSVNGRPGCDRAPGFVTSNAKIWGQRLSDGTYATVYNPSEYRWPLAISLSSDGLDYTTLSLINGEVTPLRHGGQYKSYGPQYVRGVENSEWTLPKDLWVTYSNNKEDLWVSRVPVPVRLNATNHAEGSFGQYATLADMTDWNIYSPLWANVALSGQWMTMTDSDPYDYAKVERVIPNTKELTVEFDLKAAQNSHGELHIEFVDDKGTVCSRIVVDSTAMMRVKGGARYGTLLKHYAPDTTYHITATLSCGLHRAVYAVSVPGGSPAGATHPAATPAAPAPAAPTIGKCTRQFDTPVESISRIVFRTGPLFAEPNTNTPADQLYDQPLADVRLTPATFAIAHVTSRPVCGDAIATTAAPPSPAVLTYDTFAHYADRFNQMEDENIVTTIPNAQSSEWMRNNVPLFDCPDEQMREMFYYRWWTLRKHIKRTPVGYGMTEFLVQRSYADRYNLIACAIGHHVMESRWLRDTTYLHQILRTWYFGNDGQPMTKMNKFSSWNPYAVQQLFSVQGDTAFVLSLKPRLEEEYARWERTNRLPSGLYWQGDVQDGMEESISGGRKKQYARPTINSYMYGNAMALAWMNTLTGEDAKATLYRQKADTLRRLIETKLWNPEHQFFETLRGDTLAQVREAIGYLPWYVNMFGAETQYDVAWLQLSDEQGFSAPYGLTTAERRHPEFRSHGVGKCEWDGAIWPFATSQTLTALANRINSSLTPGPTSLTPDPSRGGEGSSYSQGGSSLTPGPSPIGEGRSYSQDGKYAAKLYTPLPPAGGAGGEAGGAGGEVFFHQLHLYTESQHHRGRPYIGEYLDEKTGAWLMGDRERSRYYNHSTYNDLIITGIVGLRPQQDGSIVINPLVPQGQWPYFCLDGVTYRGHTLTIIWDQDGQRYHQGSGLTLLVDGHPVASRKDLGVISITRDN